MTVIRRLLGLTAKPEARNFATSPEVSKKPDQLSVDVAIASQQNDAAALRVRETLAQLLESADLSRVRQ